MPTRQSEDLEDVENVEAWAKVFEEVLRLVPENHRAAVLALVNKNEEAERKERGQSRGTLKFVDMSKWDDNTPGLRHWNAIMRLRSLVVQVFVRKITNNHSKEDAARILFCSASAWERIGRVARLLGRAAGITPELRRYCITCKSPPNIPWRSRSKTFDNKSSRLTRAHLGQTQLTTPRPAIFLPLLSVGAVVTTYQFQ